MKFKTLFAASAVALAAPAFAAIAPSGNSELFLVVQDSTAKESYTLDLGIRRDAFFVDGQSDLGKTLSFEVATDSNWVAFLALTSAANRKWGVLAYSGGLSNANNSILTTVKAGVTETTMKTTTNQQLNQGTSATTAGSFFSSLNSSGSHAPANDFTVNGSSLVAEADSGKGYFGESGGTSDTLNANAKFSNLNLIGTASAFYRVSGSSASAGGFVALDKFDNSQNPGSWAFDGSSLNYSLAAAVPEPESYALMLAGIAALGLMIQRRRG